MQPSKVAKGLSDGHLTAEYPVEFALVYSTFLASAILNVSVYFMLVFVKSVM
jgi:hypothetical protein